MSTPPPPVLPAKVEKAEQSSPHPVAEIPAPADGREDEKPDPQADPAGEGAQGGNDGMENPTNTDGEGEGGVAGGINPLESVVAEVKPPSFRQPDSMTTLLMGSGTQQDLENLVDAHIDIPLVQFLNNMNDANQLHDDGVIEGGITRWFERRSELGDISLLDPPMEIFVDELETALSRKNERAALRENLLNSHFVAKQKFESAATVMLEKQRVKLQKSGIPTANLESSEVYRGHVKKIEDWKQQKVASLDLDLMAFDDETNELTAVLKSIYDQIVEKVCQINQEALGQNTDDDGVDMDLMNELEVLFGPDDPNAKVSWNEKYMCAKFCIFGKPS